MATEPRAGQRIGLLGLGSIGRRLVELIRTGLAGECRLVAVLVRDAERHAAEREMLGEAVLTADADAFFATRPEVVVEAAGHAAVRQLGERVLLHGADLMLLSVGALADEALAERMRAAAERSGRQILVPSGGIAGLDAIGAAALGTLEEVTHTVRKPPRAFTAEQLGGPPPIGEPRCLFDGPASDGVRRFPENVNVAAAVALAGAGLAHTRLVVIADPGVERNTHNVRVRGDFGRLTLVMENTPTENPKTGRIVALSAAKALRNRRAAFVIGL
jgi:aspartate dehydrogenase